MIRPLQNTDTQKLLDIYNYYVINSIATFDDEELSSEMFLEKITDINNNYPFIVFEDENEILGYAYGSKFRPKPAYNKTVESTVYVKHGQHGKQIGSSLYKELLRLLKKEDFHIVLGVLTLPNEVSVKLHEKFGFKQVADLKQVGFKFGKWLDVGFWQLNL
ncbi:MAG: N-acetyltransferase [Flaviramulus sp.]|nr:GNAT family N-acetyltransferase [Flaviramulus sp.]NNC50907.1 N-acetyltransferase [Flaviramulus sp.]